MRVEVGNRQYHREKGGWEEEEEERVHDRE
jgi:hypothetical protein